MKEYIKYKKELQSHLETVLQEKEIHLNTRKLLDEVLNGNPNKELRKLVPLSSLKRNGAFFTSPRIASISLEPIMNEIDVDSRIVDATCGIGDLFLPLAEKLEIEENLGETIDLWSKVFLGQDLFKPFVDVTKMRLLFMAIQRTENLELPYFDLQKLFPKIKIGNTLRDGSLLRNATHIVLNPPYVKMNAPKECIWGNGKVNSAAIFLDKCIKESKPGTRIVAILPDVLRSGSLYRKWRKEIARRTKTDQITLLGQFHNSIDVDVFSVSLLVEKQESSNDNNWGKNHITNVEKVGDHFEIKVGTVVDYRDPYEGPKFKFITPKGVKPWRRIGDDEILDRRKFKGTVFDPPFVVVRRTSRKESKYRAIGSIVDTSYKVAVENHFIVLKPKDNSLQKCEELLGLFQTDRANTWLNNRIRCRHLTISSLRELPW